MDTSLNFETPDRLLISDIYTSKNSHTYTSSDVRMKFTTTRVRVPILTVQVLLPVAL